MPRSTGADVVLACTYTVMSGALEIPMSVEECHRLGWRLGWEYDYEGYRAIVSPADILVDVSRSVATPVEAGSIGPLRLRLAEAEEPSHPKSATSKPFDPVRRPWATLMRTSGETRRSR